VARATSATPAASGVRWRNRRVGFMRVPPFPPLWGLTPLPRAGFQRTGFTPRARLPRDSLRAQQLLRLPVTDGFEAAPHDGQWGPGAFRRAAAATDEGQAAGQVPEQAPAEVGQALVEAVVAHSLALQGLQVGGHQL